MEHKISQVIEAVLLSASRPFFQHLGLLGYFEKMIYDH